MKQDNLCSARQQAHCACGQAKYSSLVAETNHHKTADSQKQHRSGAEAEVTKIVGCILLFVIS